MQKTAIKIIYTLIVIVAFSTTKAQKITWDIIGSQKLFAKDTASLERFKNQLNDTCSRCPIKKIIPFYKKMCGVYLNYTFRVQPDRINYIMGWEGTFQHYLAASIKIFKENCVSDCDNAAASIEYVFYKRHLEDIAQLWFSMMYKANEELKKDTIPNKP